MNRLIKTLLTFCVFVTIVECSRTKRVAGGNIIENGKAAFMAGVMINNQYKCAGAIISPTKILTAAECLVSECSSKKAEDCAKVMSVKTGTNSLSRNGFVHSVESFKVHPNYKRSFDDNIAIITLTSELRLSKSSVNTVNLPKRNVVVGSNATAYGWGSTSIRVADHSDDLYSMQLRIQKSKTCKEKMPDMGANDFCTFPLNKSSGLCENDLAAPLIQAGKLIGILSYRLGAYCSLGSHAYFVNVYEYLDFIVKDLRENARQSARPDRFQERCRLFWFYTSSKRLNLANMCGINAAAATSLR